MQVCFVWLYLSDLLVVCRCALDGYPTVFTRVSEYLPWIAEQYGLEPPH